MSENINKRIKEMGERIKKCLEEKGMTDKELAEKVNVKEFVMSKYISGDRVPKGPILTNIAKELEVTSEYLLLGEDTPLEF